MENTFLGLLCSGIFSILVSILLENLWLWRWRDKFVYPWGNEAGRDGSRKLEPSESRGQESPWGGPSRRQRSKTWRSPSSPQVHQKYIYMWNNSYRTSTERWQRPQTSQKAGNTHVPGPVADSVLVLQPGVRPEPLRWESQVQDIGPPETSWPLVISIGESSPRDLHLNAHTQLHSTPRKLQCWATHAKQLARQEHNPTH